VLLVDKIPWCVVQPLQALQGGVTVVQIREKSVDTAEVRQWSNSHSEMQSD
jgi:thiamine monophosphate synthase